MARCPGRGRAPDDPRAAGPADRPRWPAARSRDRGAQRDAGRRPARRGDRSSVRRALRAAQPRRPARCRASASSWRPSSATGFGGRSRRRAARRRSPRRWRHSGSTGSRPSSMPATSNTPSPNPICCCSPRNSSASSPNAAGTSATRPGTWSRRSRPAMLPIGVTAGAAVDAAALAGAGAGAVVESLLDIADVLAAG